MKIFKLSKKYEVVCDWKKTSYGFKHTATLLRNGTEIGSAKCCYYNRTWERYEYQSVLKNVIEKYFTGAEKKKYLKIAENGQGEENSFLKTASMVAAFGGIICDKKEGKNAWKKKFLAKVPGIDFPEDFDSLPEKEKQRRLDGAIKIGLKKEA